jgi:hypothetical protein
MSKPEPESVASNVVDLNDKRRKLRPPPAPDTLAVSVTRTLENIDAIFASRRAPTDG